MDKLLQHLREKTTAMQNIHDLAEREDRALNQEEQDTYDSLVKEITALEKRIDNKKALDERLRNLKEPVTPVNKGSDGVRAGHNRAQNEPWNNYGEFLMAVVNYEIPGKANDPRLYGTDDPKNATMNTTVGSDGGFMVSTQFIDKTLETIMEESTMMQYGTNIPCGEGFNGISLPRLNESSRADGSRWGGILARWASESSTVGVTMPQLTTLDLKLAKLLSFVQLTDELTRDAKQLEAWVLKTLPSETAFVFDDAMVNADGNGKPLGILKNPGLITIAKETSQAADTIVYENLIKMWIRLPARNRKNGVWLINQEAEGQLFQMSLKIKNVAGTENVGGTAVYIPDASGGASQTPLSTLFGRPVKVIEQCPQLGDLGDIILADLSDYIVTDKNGVQNDSSMHVRFMYDEQVLRFRHRINGAPYTQVAVASKAKSTFTVSPYITLAARA